MTVWINKQRHEVVSLLSKEEMLVVDCCTRKSLVVNPANIEGIGIDDASGKNLDILFSQTHRQYSHAQPNSGTMLLNISEETNSWNKRALAISARDRCAEG